MNAFNGLSKHVSLPGATVVHEFSLEQLDSLVPGAWMYRTDDTTTTEVPVQNTELLSRIARIARSSIGAYNLDIHVHNEAYTIDPSSLATHSLGIHADGGHERGFFVMSSREPTWFYKSIADAPVPALPGQMVHVGKLSLHSAPIPKGEGTRTRVKVIPLHDFDGPDSSAGVRYRELHHFKTS